MATARGVKPVPPAPPPPPPTQTFEIPACVIARIAEHGKQVSGVRSKTAMVHLSEGMFGYAVEVDEGKGIVSLLIYLPNVTTTAATGALVYI